MQQLKREDLVHYKMYFCPLLQTGKLLVHVLDACSSGHRWILIKSSGTDVVVLAMSVAENLPAVPADEIWISYGTGRHLRHLAAHKIAGRKDRGKQKPYCCSMSLLAVTPFPLLVLREGRQLGMYGMFTHC